ncbi:transcriptional regulator GcvA (plasmid) [Roseibium aggregatum]|uniref:transcriptional regulator GcvA n=1 Tax=Roseibium aggregatum TaxID=187304 RepID=UPI00226C30E2|nr:transcriptional regulator GcvA [Roseibium aggregatum]UES60090.1 transcriptional regulator GcvA [Roseibium aggregatum]
MSRRRALPPLKALQAFEAAARLKSFTEAADEMNVTPSAVSHQVRNLEDWLACKLFIRKGRPIELTKEGMLFFEQVASSFDNIINAGKLLRRSTEPSQITVATMDSFAVNWLIPRLRELANSAYDVRVDAADEFVSFETSSVDIAVRYGDGKWPGLNIERIFVDNLVVVCSPEVHVGSFEELMNQTLLHDESAVGWPQWISGAGLPPRNDQAGDLFFSKTHFAIQAAISGHGIALASLPLVVDALADGRLIMPFSHSIPGSGAYYLCSRENEESSDHLIAFIEWLRSVWSESVEKIDKLQVSADQQSPSLRY